MIFKISSNDSRGRVTTGAVFATGGGTSASRKFATTCTKPRILGSLRYDLAHDCDVRVRKRQGGNDRNQVLVKDSYRDISEEVWVESDHGGVENEDHLGGPGWDRELEINGASRGYGQGLFQF
jgi:hypothetical protein